jgi:arylsulfatase A-like enzyme
VCAFLRCRAVRRASASPAHPPAAAHPGRVVDDFVSFTDFAPTFIELAGLNWGETGMHPAVGRSLTDILFSSEEGHINAERDHVLLGKERHDVGRPYDWGYPIRGIIRGDFLYIRNFEYTRWPAGNPDHMASFTENGWLGDTICLIAGTYRLRLENVSAQVSPGWTLVQ